jgi:hypothetical protein
MLSSRSTRNTLDLYREIGDPQADSVIEKIFGLDRVDAVNKLLKDIQKNDDLVAVEMPDELEDFLNTTDDWPSWADPEQIRLGQQLFSRYGMQLTSSSAIRRGDSQTSRFRFLFHSNCLYPQGVLWSYVRSTD